MNGHQQAGLWERRCLSAAVLVGTVVSLVLLFILGTLLLVVPGTVLLVVRLVVLLIFSVLFIGHFSHPAFKNSMGSIGRIIHKGGRMYGAAGKVFRSFSGIFPG